MVLKRNLLAIAIASVCLGVCATASAETALMTGAPQQDMQTQPAQDNEKAASDDDKRHESKKMEAVEVTGFISSIQNSTALKRNSDSIVEAVSAEQVGKLPGVSIADTLGRLPGLAVQTLNGRPQVLTIHGLGPDFSTALINGGQQVSTSNNRDVQFDQYPSSWFDNVVVHLTPQANLIGQGLAGTTDMHTIRPLDKSGPEAAVNAKYTWNDMSELAPGPGVSNKGHDFNGVWVHQFADQTLGVTLGVDFEDAPTQIQHQAPWGYPNDANGDYVIGGSKNYGITDSMKRNGVLATVQWQPNDHYTGIIDVTYDNFKEVQQAKGMEVPLGYGPDGVTYMTPDNVSNGFVEDGTYANVVPVIRNDYNSTSARVYNLNWENRFTVDDNWTINANMNYSRATRRDVNLESYSGTGYNRTGATDTTGFSELGNGLLQLSPSLDYTQGVVLTDPQAWGAGSDLVQAGFINAPRTVDYLANVRLSVERSFVSGPFYSVEFGLSNSNRNKTYHIDQTFLTLGGGTLSGGNAVETAPFTGTSCNPLSWMGIGSQLCYDPFAQIESGSLVGVPTFGSNTGTPPNWKTHENVFTPYIQFNLDTRLGDVNLRGNFGIQMQHTSQRADGQRVAPNSAITGDAITLIPVTGSASYTRYLPSMNLIFGFTDNDDLRVSAARTLARPRMDQMNAGLGVNGNLTYLPSTDPNQAYFSASGGNPQLTPTMGDNFNVSYEHYFSGPAEGYQCNSTDEKNSDLCRSGGSGYFSVSGYFIGLHDFINPSASFLYDFSSFLPYLLSPAQVGQLGTPLGIVSGPTNDGHGYVKGLQGTLNLPFDLFTPALSGFGTNLNVSRTKSSLVYPGNTTPITVPGLSKWVANGTLYYQRNGFEARISDNYRSDFLGEVSGISATRIEQTLKGGSTYDAQVSYTFDSGRLNGLTLIAQGSNLSNKIFTTFQNNDPRQVQMWERYGRTYSLGISYKF
jgi:iron complex outermembrane receptor protein